jgi:EAL domain-containing protein (putative c-di-GMP-specific phosphodiesterase class I)/GGDEF domain-containing protein
MPQISMRRQISILAVCYLLIMALYSGYHYWDTKKSLMQNADRRLKDTALATIQVIPETLHQIPISKQLAEQQELAVTRDLTNLARSLDLSYIYTLVEDQGQLLFTSSSASPNELIGEQPEYDFVYWDAYTEASPAAFQAIRQQSQQYDEYEDRWGSFRSIFFPVVRYDQETYLIGVDLDISEVNALAQQSLLKALGTALLLSLLCLPMFLYARRIIVAHARLRERAFFFDELTHLPNSRQLKEDLKRSRFPHLVMLNIDRFYYLSSSYGQAFADHVLSELAYNLKNFTHPALPTHQVYHLHLDEFAIVVDYKFKDQRNLEVFESFYKTLAETQYRMPDGKLITLDAHFGVSVEMQEPLETAQLALRDAQENNQSVVVIDREDQLPDVYRSNLHKIEQIKLAFKEDRVIPYFHPIVNAKDGSILKYEVLSRIVDSRGEIIMMPDEFIPLMIRARIYHELTFRILRKSIAAVKKDNVHLSINFSTHDVFNEELSQKILRIIAKSGVADKLQFELLETDSVVGDVELLHFISSLKELGCGVGLDDLGKAYSNFDRLTNLPIDFVKIDRGIMSQLSQNGYKDSHSLVLTERIVRFAKSKNIKTIAEYCSSKEMCSLAAGFGIDFLQGYWLGEPQPYIQKEARSF